MEVSRRIVLAGAPGVRLATSGKKKKKEASIQWPRAGPLPVQHDGDGGLLGTNCGSRVDHQRCRFRKNLPSPPPSTSRAPLAKRAQACEKACAPRSIQVHTLIHQFRRYYVRGKYFLFLYWVILHNIVGMERGGPALGGLLMPGLHTDHPTRHEACRRYYY